MFMAFSMRFEALNEIENTEWRVGKAEDVVPKLLEELDPALQVAAETWTSRNSLNGSKDDRTLCAHMHLLYTIYLYIYICYI